MNDLGMVIFSHTLSFTSKPELGCAKVLEIRYIGVARVSFTGSPATVGKEVLV